MMSDIKNPWRFLTALDGSKGVDREIIRLTREEELRIVTHMVAASRVSLLYAFSGNGKTSLIKAGVIPFFKENNYIVFTTRPRPPWSISDPSLAFKQSVLLNLEQSNFRHRDYYLLQNNLYNLEKTHKQLSDRSSDLKLKIEELIDQTREDLAHQSDLPINTEKLKSRIQDKIDDPIPKFMNEIQTSLGQKIKILIVCDQFEELFVHYGNTQKMEDFVIQLGQLWANSDINIHLLFSMREDWVGSMIEFRKEIPEIFSNYFKLNPITYSRAANVLKMPLESCSNMYFEDRAVDKILNDLVESYSYNQMEEFSEVKLTPSPQDDPFIELPALQVVANKLWESKEKVSKPFTIEHYLSHLNSDVQEQTSNINVASSILDGYLLDYIKAIKPGTKLTQAEWQELQVDALYLLTDKVRHRRALPEKILLDKVNEIRPSELELPEVNKDLLRQALQPLVEKRLVKKETTEDNKHQFELAHDFAVHTVVKNWKNQKEKRTGNLALLKQEKLKKEQKLTLLEKNEKRSLRLIQIAPLISLLAIMCSFILLFNKIGDQYIDIVSLYLSRIGFFIPIPFFLLVVLGFINRLYASMAVGGVCTAMAVIYLFLLDGLSTHGGIIYNEELPIQFLTVFILVVFVTCLKNSIHVSQKIGDTTQIQMTLFTLWHELINIIYLLAICFISLFTVVFFGDIFNIHLSDSAAFLLFMLLVIGMVFILSWEFSKKGVLRGSLWTGASIKTFYGLRLSLRHALGHQISFLLWISLICATNFTFFLLIYKNFVALSYAIIGSIITWCIFSASFTSLHREHRQPYNLIAKTQLDLDASEIIGNELSKKEIKTIKKKNKEVLKNQKSQSN